MKWNDKIQDMRSAKGFLIVAFLCGLVATAMATYFIVDFWLSPPSGQATEVFYEVHRNVSARVVAEDLEKARIVSNSQFFYWFGKLTGMNGRLKQGDYRFTTQMRPSEVFTILTSGISYAYPMTVPEGYTFHQIGELFDKLRPGLGRRFVRLCSDRRFIASLGFSPAPSSLEGYLYPDTYLVGRKMLPEEAISQMVKRFYHVFTPELKARAHELGFNVHQTITLASIIEKETGAPEERPKISSVFHNRLQKHMKLQTDPTVIYGMKTYKGNITRKDLTTFTPYNTYIIPALPPGPIASPGRDAIVAALYPIRSDLLYFVSHNDGTHEFTKTFEDHQKAVAKFQLDPKAREGKSWRDLKKRKPSFQQDQTAVHR